MSRHAHSGTLKYFHTSPFKHQLHLHITAKEHNTTCTVLYDTVLNKSAWIKKGQEIQSFHVFQAWSTPKQKCNAYPLPYQNNTTLTNYGKAGHIQN